MKLTECCPPLSDPLKDKVLSPRPSRGAGRHCRGFPGRPGRRWSLDIAITWLLILFILTRVPWGPHDAAEAVLPFSAWAFRLRSSAAGRRRKRRNIVHNEERFGRFWKWFYSAPGLVGQVIGLVPERSLGDECDVQDVHATETRRKDKHKNAPGPTHCHPPSTRPGTAVCSPYRWGLDKQRNIAKGWTRGNTRNAARACACAAVQKPIWGVATSCKADMI